MKNSSSNTTAWIYKITNLINYKCYIGQTKYPLKTRWQFHCSHAIKGKRKGHFHSAIRFYGTDCWYLEILEITTYELLDERERYWINYFDTTNREIGYNLTTGGEGGYIRSEEQCKAISERMKGNIPWNKGIPRDESVKQKIKETRRINNRDQELSIRKKGKPHPSVAGDKNPLYGTTWFNNGIVNVRRKTCPEGFVSGKLDKSKN